MKPEKLYYLYSGSVYFFFNLVFTINGIYFVESVGLNPLQLVLVGTVVETSALLFEIPTGVFADMYGRRKSIIIGLTILGVSFILEGSLPFFWIILLAQIIAGAGYTFLSGADIAWVADESETKNLDPVLLKGVQFEQIGSLAGIWASVLLGLFALNFPIVLSGVSMFFLALILRRIMKEDKFSPRHFGKPFKDFLSTLADGLGQVRASANLIIILFISLGIGLYSEGFDRLWILKFLADLRITEEFGLRYVLWFGVINSGALVLSIAVLSFLKRLSSRNSSKLLLSYLVILNTILAVAFIGFALSDNFPLALAFYWAGFVARRNDYPLYASFTNRQIEISGVRATVISVARQFDSLGQIIGGPIIGLIALSSTTIALGITGLLVLPVVLLYIWLLGRESRP
ncbi:Transporter, major facilitator family protein [Mesotoga infera]|uniref:Transporter, major facilitator family protein n=1 Tax=Mesotoga infera TaxID=1236046 RepID=A0A7Z7LGS5_9BACT|nr:MFS transporter [Mesotoga infera]SSC13801.1 Transporter, major facilitator family protein [Mesotoga infera]